MTEQRKTSKAKPRGAVAPTDEPTGDLPEIGDGFESHGHDEGRTKKDHPTHPDHPGRGRRRSLADSTETPVLGVELDADQPKYEVPDADLVDGTPRERELNLAAKVPAAPLGEGNPGNESDYSDVVERKPVVPEKRRESSGELVGADVTEHPKGEKIGRTPGYAPTDSATASFHFQQVILPIGPDGVVAPGPDSAAVTACIAAGYRPVGEAAIDGVTDHPDGVSKVVTWRVPCVRAGLASD
jgi:hypothetical protein